MKCFLVVNQLNDPFYMDYDHAFGKYIIEVGVKQGLIEAKADNEEKEMDPNMVMQLFSPLILSQWLLIDQTKEPCSAIVCPNGFLFVFFHMDDLLFVSINGDGTETEQFLHRKISVFIRLMKFMFGPVSEEIGHSSSKKSKWEFMRKMMKSWSELESSEQSFLVEAIEKLHVNQMVSEKCVEVLEWSVKSFQAVRDMPTQHAVLLVNSKLAALYSNRSAHELRARDILALAVLAQTMFPQEDISLPTASSGQKNVLFKNSGEFSDGADDVYHSAPATPSEDRRSRSSSFKVSDNSTIEVKLKHVELETRISCSGMSGDSEADTVKMVASSEGETSEKENTLLEMYLEKFPDSMLDENVEAETNDQGLSNQAVDTFAKDSTNSDFENTEKTIHSNIESRIDLVEPNKKVEDNSKLSAESDKDSISAKDITGDIQNKKLRACEVENVSSNITSRGDVLDSSSLFLPDLDPKHILETNKRAETKISDICLGKKDEEISKIEDTEEGIKGLQEVESGGSSGSRSRSSSSVFEKRRSSSSVSSTQPVSQEPDVVSVASLFSLASNTSSVVSNIASKEYPQLSAQTEPESFEQDRGSQNSPLERFNPTPSTLHILRPQSVAAREKLSSRTMESAVGSTTTSHVEPKNVYKPQTIFLETPTCRFSPYNIHTTQVLPGVTLMLLSKAPKHSLADSLFQVIHNIQDLIYGRRIKLPRSRSIYVYDIINALLGKLNSSLKKNKGRVRNLSLEIHNRWEREDLKYKLLNFLEKDVRTPIPPELESPLLELYRKLRELFAFLFLSPISNDDIVLEVLDQLKVKINAELLDYREYINVKAQRNITMTSYIEEFPGLVHFIFVDRRFHRMTAPSLNISIKDEDSNDATKYLKDKIWKMYQHLMKKLTEGYTTVIMREGDFQYSYFLWFEDYTGNPLPVQESLKSSVKSYFPGILSSSFYKDLIGHCFPHAVQGSVHCFEMFQMHLATVNPPYIAAHCKKLAQKMWEVSGESYSPINLF